MNKKFIAVGILLVLTSIIIVVCSKNSSELPIVTINDYTSGHSSRGDRDSSATKTNNNEVRFSGYEPITFTRVEQLSLGQLAKKYSYPQNLIHSQLELKLYTDDKGNLIRVTRHEGHFESVSRREEVYKEFVDDGFHVKRLGHPFININNADVMKCLIVMFDRNGFHDYKSKMDFDEETEVEIIPVTFSNSNAAIPVQLNVEIPGFVWNHKRDYIDAEWQQDSRFKNAKIEDYILSYWRLYPVEFYITNETGPNSLFTLHASNAAGQFLPELRILRD